MTVTGKDKMMRPVPGPKCPMHQEYDPMRDGEPEDACPRCLRIFKMWERRKSVVQK